MKNRKHKERRCTKKVENKDESDKYISEMKVIQRPLLHYKLLHVVKPYRAAV